jgi:hypothetical protein
MPRFDHLVITDQVFYCYLDRQKYLGLAFSPGFIPRSYLLLRDDLQEFILVFNFHLEFNFPPRLLPDLPRDLHPLALEPSFGSTAHFHLVL